MTKNLSVVKTDSLTPLGAVDKYGKKTRLLVRIRASTLVARQDLNLRPLGYEEPGRRLSCRTMSPFGQRVQTIVVIIVSRVPVSSCVRTRLGYSPGYRQPARRGTCARRALNRLHHFGIIMVWQ